MWKPVLSAANQVRSIRIPPNGRTATRPSGSRLPGAAPVLQLDELGGGFVDKELDGILVGHPVGTGNRGR